MSAGLGEVEGEDRKDDRDVICGSVRSCTRVERGIESLARRVEDVGCEMP